jgi:epoxide hydrolase-like predicted phosphatase
MIKAVVFDLDGVYFVKGKENFIRNLVSLGVTEAEAKRVFYTSDEMKQYKRGELTDEQFWLWAITEWKLSMSVERIIKLLIDGYKENKPVIQAVKKVRALGIKTLVCSNNFPARIQGLQKRFRFLDNFDVAVMAYEVGALKPDKKILEELIARAQVKPEEIFFADDREDTIKNAQDLGIQAFHYTTFDNFLADLQKLEVSV